MSETPSLINPFELLGFDSKKPNVDLKKLKKNYYNLAILCHPDKGGDKTDMIMLQSAYNYIKKQVELSNEKNQNFEECLDEFQTFMKNQSNEPPPFSQVYEEAHVWLQEFNNKFYEQKLDHDINAFDPNKEGYGSFMDPSEYDLKITQPELITSESHKLPKYQTNLKEFYKPVKHEFDWELMETEHPESYSAIMDHGEFYDLKQKTIDNFSLKTDHLNMTDYRMAFTSSDVKTTKSQKIEKTNHTEFEAHLQKLKADRYVLDSQLDEQEIVKSFVMLDDQEINELPKLEQYISHNTTQHPKKWF